MNKVSIILVNYNTSDHIIKCLDSLKTAGDSNEYEIIIVDNKSDDVEIKKLESHLSEKKIILNKTNAGFGSACNIGAKNAKGNYLLFANPDTIFIDNIFPELIKVFESDNKIGAASCALTNQNNELVYSFNDFPGLKYEFTEAIGYGTHKNILRKIDFLKENRDKVFECDWVIGAFMFIRKTEFEKTGGFDENFFLYYEDTDLCKRIKSNGNKIIMVPYLNAIHTQMSSVRSPQGENIFYYHLNRSNLIYSYKHFSYFEILLIRFFHITGYTFRILSLPFRKRFKNKKKLKYYQYSEIIKLYFSSYNMVIKNKYKALKSFNKISSENYEEFWKK